MKLDECVTDISVATRIVIDRSAEIVCLKLSKQGGLTKGRRVRDYLLEHGFPVVSEDIWGGEIVSAAVEHFAASTPSGLLFNTTDLYNYNTVGAGKPGPETRDGRLAASNAPGLGMEPDHDVLGAPSRSSPEPRLHVVCASGARKRRNAVNLMKPVAVRIEDIYVPAARRKELDPARIDEMAEQILNEDEEDPIQVRKDKDRYVLVRGVHRLEARKALGEETIQALIVQARQH